MGMWGCGGEGCGCGGGLLFVSVAIGVWDGAVVALCALDPAVRLLAENPFTPLPQKYVAEIALPRLCREFMSVDYSKMEGGGCQRETESPFPGIMTQTKATRSLATYGTALVSLMGVVFLIDVFPLHRYQATHMSLVSSARSSVQVKDAPIATTPRTQPHADDNQHPSSSSQLSLLFLSVLAVGSLWLQLLQKNSTGPLEPHPDPHAHPQPHLPGLWV